MVVRVDIGNAGAGGIAAALVTSTRVKGNCGVFAAAACLISTPVGPLDGRLAQPARSNVAVESVVTPRNDPLRCGTRIIGID